MVLVGMEGVWRYSKDPDGAVTNSIDSVLVVDEIIDRSGIQKYTNIHDGKCCRMSWNWRTLLGTSDA